MDVRSRAVVLLLMIHCSLFVEGLCLVLVLLCITKFCNHLDEEEKVGCFTLFVSLTSCDCLIRVAFPHGGVA